MKTLPEVFEWAKSAIEDYNKTSLLIRNKFYKGKISYHEFCEKTNTLEESLEKMLSEKMEYLGSGAYSNAFAFALEGKEYVLKYSQSGEDIEVPSEEFLAAHPFFAERYLKPIINAGAVLIQPKADTVPESEWRKNKKMNKAANWLARKFRMLYDCDFDCHGGNIGFVNGKIMIFDPLIEWSNSSNYSEFSY